MEEEKKVEFKRGSSLGAFKSTEYYDIGNCHLTVAHGNIVHFKADAIVNVTTEELVANISEKEDFVGIGLAADINKACGPKLREACLEFELVSPDCRCPTGEARITEAFNLKTAKYIIHTVGPMHAKYDKEKAAELLSNCYLSCLNLAVERQLDSVAFPLISSGLLGYPLKEAIEIALRSITVVAKREYPKYLYFIMQSKNKYNTFENLARKRLNPKSAKAAKKSPFITKGSTFRMSDSQKVMLGLNKKAIDSFKDLFEEAGEDVNGNFDEKKD